VPLHRHRSDERRLFSRTEPIHKQEIVKLLQSMNEVIAMVR
jgi:magnesium-transporting ATPase (P-type)